MNPDFSVFRGKRVLITGHTGFKGSWLALWLGELGAEVTGYALPPKRADDHFNLLGLEKRIRHLEGDVRDGEHFSRVCREIEPEIVFHLAAQALVRLSYTSPKLTFDTNVLGGVNVLEAARAMKSLRALVFITSDKCYSNKEWVWGYRETDELGGRDPYSASKAAAELVFASYQDAFFSRQASLGAATTRAGNVIGGGDWAEDRIVPDCILALRANKAIVLRNPKATRPWQHVLEPLSGYLVLAAELLRNPQAGGGAWNFGPTGNAIRTVEDVARGIVRRWGSGEVVVDPPLDPPHEAGLLHLSIDKAIHHLGWHPRWTFEETLDHTVNWYKMVLAGRPAHEVSRGQIKEYMGRGDD